MKFYPLHQLFDAIASQFEGYTYLIAERVTTLGSTAMGTVRIADELSTLLDYLFVIIQGKDRVISLADRLATYAQIARNAIERLN